jgi:1-acyl-sn-glycerol-3-phosphate acyltransferase
MVEIFRKFMVFITKIFLGIFYRVKIINQRNVPEKGPVLLFSNHIGELDMFLIGFKIKRWVYWMAKEELFRIPLIGIFIHLLGAFPVRRGKGDAASVKTALELLRKGHVVGVFPEGTRRKGKNKKSVTAKGGAAMLAVKSGAPILPVALKGDYKLFSTIKVIFGKPFSLDIEENKKYNKEELREMSSNIMNSIYSLLEVN